MATSEHNSYHMQEFTLTFNHKIANPLNMWNNCIIMAALRSRCEHDIFALPFYFLSSSNLSSCRLDVYHTSTHDVTLVRI